MTQGYDPKPLATLLERWLEERDLSQRQASLEAGLDRGALSRFIGEGRRPSRHSLIMLADYFGVNPNRLLELVGYESLEIFETAREGIPPEVAGLVERLQAIADPVQRSKVIAALEVILDGWAAAGANESDGLQTTYR